ncbi:MAG TPA: tetratricopeptide repeat protein [Chloroflexota bacterium]|nr:tetratricopeptide repeat protein [Chloroflexota bacterium]
MVVLKSTEQVLPSPANPLLGREAALSHVRGLIAGKRARLLTLTGAGGTGKTRLALELAAELGSTFDNTWFVDLTSIDTDDLLPSAVAQAIGVQEGGSQSLTDIFKEVLCERPSLLILDNFEHVMGAVPYVAELLGLCSDVVILATSREPLALRAEHVYFVEPLALPDLGELQDAVAVRQAPSVRLFEERVRARRASFVMTDDLLPVVAEICVRLDGLPLAIELAAAQAALLSPRVILSRLSAQAPFVISGPRDLPARHQTLRATVAWSYDLLTPVEQRVFRQCGVFASGFSAEAVEAVCGELEPGMDALMVLGQLVIKSLVRVSEDSLGSPRFSLLDTIRAYAVEQLTAAAEIEQAQRQHALYYVGLAETLQASLRGPGMSAALNEMARDYANFRAVFGWSSSTGDLAMGLRLAGALYRFWNARGHLAEARSWLAAALPRSEAVPLETRAIGLHAAGVMAGMQHDAEHAVTYFTQSLEIWKTLGDATRQAAVYLNLGLVAQDSARLEDARGLFERAQEMYAAVGDRWGLASAMGTRARIARELGDLDGAMRLFRDCLILFRDLGDDWGTANSLNNIGQVLLALEDRSGALDAFRQALEVRRSLGNILHIAECLEGIAAVVATSQPRQATHLLGAAEALRETSGAPIPPVEQQAHSQIVARVRGRLREDTFAAAWSQGRGLSLTSAIDLAMRDEVSSSPLPSPTLTDGPQMLSPREREIAQLIAQGASNRDVAEQLVVSIKTVETHVQHIFAKLDVRTRAEIAVWATRRGLV